MSNLNTVRSSILNGVSLSLDKDEEVITLVNLMKHDCTCSFPEPWGSFVVKPSGVEATVSTKEVEGTLLGGTLPIVSVVYGEVQNLPDPEAGIMYIVNAMVFERSSRKDLLAPDTGKSAIRDEKGMVKAITRFKAK
jgi:hypothetical protein